jgi:hypothetical protein
MDFVLVVVFITVVLLVVLGKLGFFAEQLVVKHAPATDRVDEPKRRYARLFLLLSNALNRPRQVDGPAKRVVIQWRP